MDGLRQRLGIAMVDVIDCEGQACIECAWIRYDTARIVVYVDSNYQLMQDLMRKQF